MEAAFKRLQSIFGGIKYTYPDGTDEIVIHFSNVKFIKKGNEIICRDKDYWDFQEARAIANPKYLARMSDIILSLSRTYMVNNRHKNIFKKSIRGMCKFGENLHLGITEDQDKAMITELLVKHVKEVAMKYNTSENYCKQLLKK